MLCKACVCFIATDSHSASSCMLCTICSSIRSNHLKSRGDAALKDGNLREAWTRSGAAYLLLAMQLVSCSSTWEARMPIKTLQSLCVCVLCKHNWHRRRTSDAAQIPCTQGGILINYLTPPMLCSYGEALTMTTTTNPARPRMLANRALAFTKAGRYADALADADAAVAAAPTWDKGHWRRGAALAGLKRAPDAVAAYHRAWQLSKGAGSMCVLCSLGYCLE